MSWASKVVSLRPEAFLKVAIYILMNGTGVGFSVEEKSVDQLPAIPATLVDTSTVISVDDSKLGWASALKELMGNLYGGRVPAWDVSKVRPAGAPLKTFGGRASGPAPLVDLFKYTIATLSYLICHHAAHGGHDFKVENGVFQILPVFASDGVIASFFEVLIKEVEIP